MATSTGTMGTGRNIVSDDVNERIERHQERFGRLVHQEHNLALFGRADNIRKVVSELMAELAPSEFVRVEFSVERVGGGGEK